LYAVWSAPRLVDPLRWPATDRDVTRYVVSGFSRTSWGPPEGGHYVHVESAL